MVAAFRRDRKACRHGKADPRHFGKARSLASEQIFHCTVAFRFSCPKKIYVFHKCPPLRITPKMNRMSASRRGTIYLYYYRPKFISLAPPSRFQKNRRWSKTQRAVPKEASAGSSGSAPPRPSP